MPTDYFRKPGHEVTRYVIFVSSGDDVLEQRELFEAMVDAANHQLYIHQTGARRFALYVDKWEHDAPQRSPSQGKLNDRFVDRARDANATVVLLSTVVRPGTREEIEGVLGEDGTQLSVIWMEKPEDKNKSRPLKKFLRENKDQFLYARTGPPGTQESILPMVRVLTAAMAHLIGEGQEEVPFNESR